MPKNRTLIKANKPRFGVNEAAYIRESAVKGFAEPIIIARIRFEPSTESYVYRWLKNRKLSSLFVTSGKRAFKSLASADDRDLSPLEIREEELINVCEALDIQARFLEKQLNEANEELARVCGTDNGEELSPISKLDDAANFVISPSVPKFSINEVTYLIESAESVGRLEKVRVDQIRFDTEKQKWIYSFVFNPRPGENMTLGDRIDLKESIIVERIEDDLATICEVIPLRVNFLEKALIKSRSLRDAVCN